MDQLQLATSLFKRLADQGIAYAHWKSNEHLDDALLGRTDLDLLVDPRDADPFRSVAARLGFVPIYPPTARDIPGLEGLLGFDPATGTLLHLDVHYRLVLGERYVKNHHLPLEQWLLENTRTLGGVRVPSAPHEFLLLYVRSMLKTSRRQLLAAAVRGRSPLPSRIENEAKWLGDQVSDEEALRAAETSNVGLTGDEVLQFKRRIANGGVDWRYVHRYKRSLRRRLRGYERQSRLEVLLRKTRLRIRSTPWMENLGYGIPRRHLQPPAPVIAVIGADGSGKSRLTRDLEDWLGAKLEVRHMYFGQPKSGVMWKLLNKPGSLHRRHLQAGRKGAFSRFLSAVSPGTDALKWTYLARERKRMADSAHETAVSGETVIEERFPLSQFWSMDLPMDGPRLQNKRQGRRPMLSRVELRTYESVKQPDLFLVLDADLETLHARKTDLTIEEHQAKVEAVKALKPSEQLRIIDVELPYEDVLLEAKRVLWELIDARA